MAQKCESAQEDIRAMTEIFDGLSMIADPISEKDHVVHYFASQSARLVHAGYCS